MDRFTIQEQFLLIFFVIGKKLWLPLSDHLGLDWSNIEKDHLNVKDGTMMSAVGYFVGYLIGIGTREQTLQVFKNMTGLDPLVNYEPHPI